MVRVVVRYGDASYDLDVDPADGVEVRQLPMGPIPSTTKKPCKFHFTS